MEVFKGLRATGSSQLLDESDIAFGLYQTDCNNIEFLTLTLVDVINKSSH